MTQRFITKGRGPGRKVIPLKDGTAAAKVPKVKMDPKLQLLKDINARKIITEAELRLVFSRLNHGVYTADQVNKMLTSFDGLKLTSEQNKKGYEYLMDQWKTPKGVERKNSPFGYREEDVLKDFKEIRLVEAFDAGNIYRSYHIPIYNVYAKDGSLFMYHMRGRAVNIIG